MGGTTAAGGGGPPRGLAVENVPALLFRYLLCPVTASLPRSRCAGRNTTPNVPPCRPLIQHRSATASRPQYKTGSGKMLLRGASEQNAALGPVPARVGDPARTKAFDDKSAATCSWIPSSFAETTDTYLDRYIVLSSLSSRELPMVEIISPTAEYLAKAIRLSGNTQREIAQEIGLPRPNSLSMMKLGTCKVPIERIPALAKACRSVLPAVHQDCASGVPP